MSQWWQIQGARSSDSWKAKDWESSDWTDAWSKTDAWSNSWGHWPADRPKAPAEPASIPDVPPPAPTFPNTFSPDAACHDKTPVAGHQLFRVVQPTEWSRKTGIAGRKVEDVRLHELCHRGMAEFSMRLVSEGRFQGIVWTRSVQESVFVTSLLKKIRDAHLNIDDVARTFFTQDVPDKHKDSAKFMGPLAEELFQAMQARAPSQDPAIADELSRARAKLAAAGIQLTPSKKRTSEPASSAADPPPPSEPRGREMNILT